MKTHSYPAWFYGPNGQSEIFQHDGEVPAGWQDHPSKVITPEKTGSKPLPPKVDKVPAEKRGAAPVDAKNDATGQATGGKATDNATGDQSNTLDADGWPWTPSFTRRRRPRRASRPVAHEGRGIPAGAEGRLSEARARPVRKKERRRHDASIIDYRASVA
jgi:hypothetical protein